jgi:hypothetical protein
MLSPSAVKRAGSNRLGVSSSILLLLGLSAGGPDLAGSEETAQEAIQLPKTLEQVWYRPGHRRGFGGAKHTGDLTLTADTIYFTTKRKEIIIPMKAIRVASFGKMRGDVDTDWLVLSIEHPGLPKLLGLRDGRRFGYGQQTEQLRKTVMAALRLAPAAQFDVPEGYAVFEGMDRQFMMAFPVDWSTHPVLLVETEDGSLWGKTLVTAQPIDESGDDVRSFDRGELPGFFIDTRELVKGMSCKGFSKQGRKTLLDWIAEVAIPGSLTASRAEPPAEPVVESIDMDRCMGLRVLFRGAGADGIERVLDVRAVADSDNIILLGLPSLAAEYDQRLNTFEKVVSSFRLAVAKE